MPKPTHGRARSLFLLSLVLLLAAPAPAPKPAPKPPEQKATGYQFVQRTITFRFDPKLVSTEVHDIHVRAEAVTMVVMPWQIRYPEGVVVKGFKDQFDVRGRRGHMVLIHCNFFRVGAKPIPMTITSVEGRLFRFQLLALANNEVDGEVKVEVAMPEARRPVAPPPDALVEVLLGKEPIAVRGAHEAGLKELARPAVAPGSGPGPQLQTVARWGNRFYVRIWRKRPERDGPWKVDAEMEGGAGTLLNVVGVYQREDGWNDVAVIMADVPEGAGPGYVLRGVRLRNEGIQIALLKEPVVP